MSMADYFAAVREEHKILIAEAGKQSEQPVGLRSVFVTSIENRRSGLVGGFVTEVVTECSSGLSRPQYPAAALLTAWNGPASHRLSSDEEIRAWRADQSRRRDLALGISSANKGLIEVGGGAKTGSPS